MAAPGPESAELSEVKTESPVEPTTEVPADGEDKPLLKDEKDEKGKDAEAEAEEEPVEPLPVELRASWYMNTVGTAFGFFMCYQVHSRIAAPSAAMSSLYTGSMMLSWALALAIAGGSFACQGRLDATRKKMALPATVVMVVLMLAMLFSGEVHIVNKALLWLCTTAIVSACTIGTLGTLSGNTNVLFGYQAFWLAYLVVFVVVCYYLDIYAHNSHPDVWKPRLTDIWEKTASKAPEVICSLQSHYHCSGFQMTCGGLGHHRLGCVTCPGKHYAPKCMKTLQANLAERETLLVVLATTIGAEILALMGASALALFTILRDRAAGAGGGGGQPTEKDMHQAEPTVKEIMGCRLVIMALMKELDAGKAVPQESFDKAIEKIQSIDASVVKHAGIRGQIVEAKRQFVDQVRQLKERAKAEEEKGLVPSDPTNLTEPPASPRPTSPVGQGPPSPASPATLAFEGSAAPAAPASPEAPASPASPAEAPASKEGKEDTEE